MQVLKVLPEAKVRIPMAEEFEEYMRVVKKRHPYIGERRCVLAMDGLKIGIQKSPHYIIQEFFYNGYTCNHYVTNMLVFTPASTIIVCGINIPRSVRDSEVANVCSVYEKLRKIFEDFGIFMFVDSVFCLKSGNHLIKSGKCN